MDRSLVKNKWVHQEDALDFECFISFCIELGIIMNVVEDFRDIFRGVVNSDKSVCGLYCDGFSVYTMYTVGGVLKGKTELMTEANRFSLFDEDV
jgi:hypothetical protein